jgi:hypothetical protein
MAEMTAAERKELEALRAEKVARERQEQGIYTGKVHCSTVGCEFEDQPAELRKDVIQVENKDLGIVENEFTRWVPLDHEFCPNCEYPLTVIEPDAQSVFPRNYRWIYPKPVE